jgi:hypothetical protein
MNQYFVSWVVMLFSYDAEWRDRPAMESAGTPQIIV